MSGVGWLHHIRHRIAARLVRMGYNVLILDNDVLLFNDIYKWFKAKPFSDYQFFTASEDESMWNINVGVVYVQNARPDGPAAWWLAEVRGGLRAAGWVDCVWVVRAAAGCKPSAAQLTAAPVGLVPVWHQAGGKQHRCMT